MDDRHTHYNDNFEAVFDNALPFLDTWFHHAPDYHMFNQFLHRNGIKTAMDMKNSKVSKVSRQKLHDPRHTNYLGINKLNNVEYRNSDREHKNTKNQY